MQHLGSTGVEACAICLLSCLALNACFVCDAPRCVDVMRLHCFALYDRVPFRGPIDAQQLRMNWLHEQNKHVP